MMLMLPTWPAVAVVLAWMLLCLLVLWRLWLDAQSKDTIDPETWGRFLAEIGIVRGRWLR